MAVSTNEITVVYGAVTLGGSTARQIDRWYADEHDYVNGEFTCTFITTAATDAAFASELNTIRNEFRKPRQDLTITLNTGGGAQTLLSRKHSDNTGLNTYPFITKDGDPADTARSRHFTVRVRYELPADNLSQSFRRGSITGIEYTPSRRRTVTVEGDYTANSTDGTTAADTQYFAQITSAETTLLNVVDSTQTWERVFQDVQYSETRKVIHFIRKYRELLVNQSIGTLDNTKIVDPHMEFTVEQMGIEDSAEFGVTPTGGILAGAAQGGPGTTQAGPTSTGQEQVSQLVKKPILITCSYDANIDFGQTIQLQTLWDTDIRPWIVARAKALNPSGTLILIDEQPAFEDYENHVRASVSFMSYSPTIIKLLVTWEDSMVTGATFYAVTNPSPFAFYKFQGPAVRQMTCTEDREEITNQTSSRAYIASQLKQAGPGAAGLGENWVLISREPGAAIVKKGLTGAAGLPTVNIAKATITTVFRYIEPKAPSVQNAGKVTGNDVATG